MGLAAALLLSAAQIALSPPPASAQALSAEELFEAVEVQLQSADGQATPIISHLLDRIVNDHPTSDIALLIKINRDNASDDAEIVRRIAARLGDAPAQAPAAAPTATPAPSPATETAAPLKPDTGPASEADLVAEARASQEEALRSDGPARVAANRRSIALLEQAALDFPGGEVARRLRNDEPVNGIDPGALRREIATIQGDPLLPPPPPPEDLQMATERDEAALGLTRDTRREVQGRLTAMGHDPRGVDGVFGPGSRGAIRAWQGSQGWASTGYLNRAQLEELRRQSQAEYDRWRSTQAAAPAGPARRGGVPVFTNPRKTDSERRADLRRCGANINFAGQVLIAPSRMNSLTNCMRRLGYRVTYR